MRSVHRAGPRRREPRTAAGVPRDGRIAWGAQAVTVPISAEDSRGGVGGAARRAGKRTWDRGRARRTRLRGSCDARSRSSEPHAPSALSSVARPLRPSEDRRRGRAAGMPSVGKSEMTRTGKSPGVGCVFLSRRRVDSSRVRIDCYDTTARRDTRAVPLASFGKTNHHPNLEPPCCLSSTYVA